MRIVVLSFLSVLTLSRCESTEVGLVPYRCLHPAASAIATRTQAILAARRAWYCIKTDLAPTPEADWLMGFDAGLVDDVWHVSVIIPPGYAGGGLNMEIARGDSHVQRVYLTQ
jgi:hypothetical protein